MSAPSTNPLDIIAREVTNSVTERVLGEVEERVAGAVQAAQAEAQRRIEELISANQAVIPELISTELVTTPQDSSKDAKSRALRTLLQGGVATIVVAVLMAIVPVLNGDGFDITDSADWKVVATTAFGAVIMAGAAYVQRLVNPPKGL